MWRKFSSGERFQSSIIVRRDEKKSEVGNSIKIEIELWNTKKEEREKKNKKRARIREENTRENMKIFADYHREGVLSRDQKICAVLPPQTNPDQLQQMVTSTHTHLWNKHANPVTWSCNNNSWYSTLQLRNTPTCCSLFLTREYRSDRKYNTHLKSETDIKLRLYFHSEWYTVWELCTIHYVFI